MVDNVKCEVQGIIEALNLIVEACKLDRSVKNCFIFSDCRSAIDIICIQTKAYKNLNDFRRIWAYGRELKDMGVEVRIIWVPGHADI